jgi:hypothetical protein
MLLAAMLAMVLAAAAPAFADHRDDHQGVQTQEQDQDATSGDVTNEGSGGVDVSGDNASFEDVNIAQCTAVLNQVNTGNQQNQQAVNQYGQYQYAEQYSDQYIVQNADLVQYCAQLVGDVTTEAAAEEAVIAGAGGGAGGGGGGGGGGAAGGGGGQLPATGGISLLTLGAGALLVAGGLVARRIVR